MTIKEKLFANRRIHEETGCWLWTAGQNGEGYGSIWIDGKAEKVHRISYREFIGEPKNLVCHKIACPFRHCFNPEHLYDGTIQDNVRDRDILAHQANHNRGKTHCKAGHEFTPENTLIRSSGARNCKACQKERDRIRHLNTYIPYKTLSKSIKVDK